MYMTLVRSIATRHRRINFNTVIRLTLVTPSQELDLNGT
jgi:hypothetical protein